MASCGCSCRHLVGPTVQLGLLLRLLRLLWSCWVCYSNIIYACVNCRRYCCRPHVYCGRRGDIDIIITSMIDILLGVVAHQLLLLPLPWLLPQLLCIRRCVCIMLATVRCRRSIRVLAPFSLAAALASLASSLAGVVHGRVLSGKANAALVHVAGVAWARDGVARASIQGAA